MPGAWAGSGGSAAASSGPVVCSGPVAVPGADGPFGTAFPSGFLLHPLLPFLGGFFGGLFRGMLVPEKQSQAQHCQDHQGQELMERGAGAVGPILFAEALYQEFLEFRKHGSIHPF